MLPFYQGGCQHCGRELKVCESHSCLYCRREAPRFDRTLTLFRYEKPADHWIQQLKFKQRLHFAPLLGGLMWQQRQQQLQALDAEAVIPVPLHRKRLYQRGFNQALELARPLARGLKLPLNHRDLIRLRHTKEQSSLEAAQRPANVKDAFRCNSKRPPRRVILVDDIITTGNTANSAAYALKQAGVEEVSLVVFARTQWN